MRATRWIKMLWVCCAAVACAAQQPTAAVDRPGLALPAVISLDTLSNRTGAALDSIDVTAPLAAAGTVANAGSLDFSAPLDSCAWALYRVADPGGLPLRLSATGSGPLWIMAPDFEHGVWQYFAPLQAGAAELDLMLQGGLKSPGGFYYFAAACAQGQSGSLASLAFETLPDELYSFTAWPEDSRGTIVLSWSVNADSVRIYRSTLPDDPQPYLVDEVAEAAKRASIPPPEPKWQESVAIDPADGSWIAATRDHGTPADPADDYPAIAPELDYYYFIVPIVAGGEAQPPSAEVKVRLAWGERRSARRSLPSTAAQTRCFADQLLPGGMSAAQIEWCAENLVGTQKIFKGQADEFRKYNPDFVVLGYHLGVGAGNIGNISGLDWDDDADWPYVNAHESWFMHPAGSSQPDGRALQQDWNWFVTDPASGWSRYLPANLAQLLGEDHFDGWFVDSCSEPWNTDPPQWWPDGESMFGYFTPRLDFMLGMLCLAAAEHPLKPYIIPNAGNYVTTASDIRYYDTDWACDGIMVEGHGHWSPGEYYSAADWALQHDRILEHQAHGLATILQTRIFTPDQQDRLFVYASYLLVRGERTYINWLGDDGLDTIWSSIGQWYPEFDTDTELGPPSAAPAVNVAAMLQDGLYRRNFTNGFVLVNPGANAVDYTCPYHMLKLTVAGGGNIDNAGLPVGSHDWQVINGLQTLPAQSALIILDILD